MNGGTPGIEPATPDENDGTVPDPAMQSYRDWLVKAEHTSSRDFERTLTTLASSGLAVSLVFVHDVAPHPKHTFWLIASWVCLAFSLLAILMSYLTSMMATRAIIKEIDKPSGDPYRRRPSAKATVALNWSSAGLLVVGVLALVAFASLNVRQEASSGPAKTPAVAPTSPTVAGAG